MRESSNIYLNKVIESRMSRCVYVRSAEALIYIYVSAVDNISRRTKRRIPGPYRF